MITTTTICPATIHPICPVTIHLIITIHRMTVTNGTTMIATKNIAAEMGATVVMEEMDATEEMGAIVQVLKDAKVTRVTKVTKDFRASREIPEHKVSKDSKEK
jgi:hypothetical protein